MTIIRVMAVAGRGLMLSALLLGSISGCAREENAAAQPRDTAAPAPVVLAVAEQRDVPVQIHAIANVEPFATVTIRSRVAGQLLKAHVTPGQDVKVGDLLFEIDPRPYDAALHEAQANLERDDALAKNAQIDATRIAGLVKDNAATREEADKAKFAAMAADATVRADQASVENAKLQLDYTQIRSPVEGRAGSLLADQGNIVRVDDTPLLTINQVRPIYVSFAVPEQDLEQIRQFSKDTQPDVAVIVPPQIAPSERGKLTFIDNRVDTDTGTIRLRGTFNNEDRGLWPGQFVQAVLNLNVEKNAVVIPSRAVQNGQQGQFVFVMKDDNTVEMRPVKIRRTVGDDSLIDQGVAVHDKVVTDGQLRLVPGAKVQVKEQPVGATTTASAAMESKAVQP